MTRTILLETLRGETRLAVIEGDRLCEFCVGRPNSDDAAGSIYLGRVENVVPGMNAAFVDIGLEKNAFLRADDIPDAVRGDRGLERQLGGARIEALVRPGQSTLVQVTRAQSGHKGHRVSCHVTLPGRGLVLMPGTRCVGVSRKLTDEAERARLHDIARSLMAESGMGMIVRTAAGGMDEPALRAEFSALSALWSDITRRAGHADGPVKLFSNESPALRCVRDLLNEETDAVWAEDEASFAALRRHAEALAPQYLDRIRLHRGDVPLFDIWRVDRQLEKALQKYVWLDSGGSLVIEETEAMTVIDVNTGKFTGRKALDDTIFRLNCEAAEEIVRQLRLRNIGGIVVVDFIDMAEPGQNEALIERLKALAAEDAGRLNVVGMTGLGLVELTRKKQRRPLSRQLMHTCSDCGGDGVVPSHETVARRAVREIWRRRRAGDGSPLLVETASQVAGWLRRVGAPEGGPVYVCAVETLGEGEYRLSPADEAHLPGECKRLK